MARLLMAAAGVEKALRQTMDLWASTSFDAAMGNCALAVLDYAEMATGRSVEPPPHALGLFARAALWGDDAALAAFADDALAQLGAERVENVGRGDVGLLAGVSETLTAAICLGDAWAARGAPGFATVRVRAAHAWRLTCPRP